ncbi:unnamed protein product [Euphydryas editha]|uniref:DDE-1 domain-containing protein n=1 Tax=Euphydryas editha TaxID=104508 RepID=A0AAU9UTD3_EUPED|nr:unnamed protein product [Euphydryas editha]
MVGDLFVKWMKHFVSFAGCNFESKIILILDGHSSHKKLEALEFAKPNGVLLLCLPPHCTHRMQPLDVSFFGPLDAYYNREMNTWLKTHPGRTVGLHQVAGIFGRAYGSAAFVGKIMSGFEKTNLSMECTIFFQITYCYPAKSPKMLSKRVIENALREMLNNFLDQ